MKKYIFVSGGVISGVGKGIASASIGFILKSYGLNITMIKADPYVNVDAGTMNPLEHGETFVLEDGLETDMDLGHYERFTGELFDKYNYMTTGSIYQEVIRKERALEYKGKCVEVMVHPPKEIINRIKSAGNKHRSDVIIVEIGGTAGEYQNVLFLEANRIMKLANPEDVIHIHVSYLPVPSSLGEMKTKPTQMSVKTLNSSGIVPDFILARGPHSLDAARKNKIKHFCNIEKKNIISAPDVKNVYEIPINFEKENLGKRILEVLNIKRKRGKLFEEWKRKYQSITRIKKNVKIIIVGKYYKSGDFNLKDSYVSVEEAIKHACWHLKVNPLIDWIVADDLDKDKKTQKLLEKSDAIIVPQGWGSRGVEGKLAAVKIAREKKIPYLGLCFGMQMAAIEFARNVMKLRNANSEEANPNAKHKIIHLMENQKKLMEKKHYGGTIRLGAWPCKIKKGSLMAKYYGKYKNDHFPKATTVKERHRHRYEFNSSYTKRLEKKGMIISGTGFDGKLVETIELSQDRHPFFVGTQYHPELKSQFLNPHPLFLGLIEVALKKK